jgi:hypothetical protein
MKSLIAFAVLAVFCGCKSETQKCQAGSFEEDIPRCQTLCDKDDAVACDHLGYLQMLYRHDEAAKTAYSKACKLGNQESCAYVK